MISGESPERRPWHLLSVEELAALADVPSRRVRQELEEGILPGREKGNPRHCFGTRDVFYFRLVRHLEQALTLSQSARRELHEAIVRVRDGHRPDASPWRKTDTGWEFTAVQASFDARQPFTESVKNVRLFIQGKRRIESCPDIMGGEPVFKGTRISVRHVGQMLLNGVPRAEVREDFPRLDEDDLSFAMLFAPLPRQVGRPRKALVSRREGT